MKTFFRNRNKSLLKRLCGQRGNLRPIKVAHNRLMLINSPIFSQSISKQTRVAVIRREKKKKKILRDFGASCGFETKVFTFQKESSLPHTIHCRALDRVWSQWQGIELESWQTFCDREILKRLAITTSKRFRRNRMTSSSPLTPTM